MGPVLSQRKGAQCPSAAVPSNGGCALRARALSPLPAAVFLACAFSLSLCFLTPTIIAARLGSWSF